MKIRVSLIFILILDKFKSSLGFCNELTEYACKQEGITQCRPKTDRCHDGSKCDRPLPIEKPPCKEQCQPDREYWCEERGQCIRNNQFCDCGPGKVYCDSTATGTYSCENRNGIASSNIFSICRDGKCSSDCTLKSVNTTCEEGQFKCGNDCKDLNVVTEFRSCQSTCISSEEYCYKAASNIVTTTASTPSSTNEPKNTSNLGTVIFVIVLIIFIALFGFFIYKNWETLKTLYTLHQLKKRMTNGFKEKEKEINNSRDDSVETINLVKKQLDTDRYETLCKEIKAKNDQLLWQLLPLRRNLQCIGDVEQHVPLKTHFDSIVNQIEKFIKDDYLCTDAGEDVDQGVEIHTENKKETSSAEESRLKQQQEQYPCLLIEEDQQGKWCYCLICLQAGVINEFTKNHGVAATDENIKTIETHLWDSSKDKKDEATSLNIEAPTKEIDPSLFDSHLYAEQAITIVEQFSKDVIESRSTFSLILYEKNNVLSVILKGLKVLESGIQDIYIPLDILEMEEKEHGLSILSKIQKIMELWEIDLGRISSISTVIIGSKLPSRSADACEMFCKLPKCQCISLHNISHESTLDMHQENIENVFLKDLRALIEVLSQSHQGNFKREQLVNQEPISHITDSITEIMFEKTTAKSLNDVISFVKANPKSIQQRLINAQEGIQRQDSNETDEYKQIASELNIDIMDKLSSKAAIFLYELVNDMFQKVFLAYKSPDSDWDRKHVQKEVKYLKSFLNKEEKNKKDSPTLDKSQECLKELEDDMSETDNIWFGEYKTKVITEAIEDLKSSYPLEYMAILRAMSKLLNPKKKFVIQSIATSTVQKGKSIKSKDYQKPKAIVGKKFPKILEPKTKKEMIEFNEIAAEFSDLDSRQTSVCLITKYSDNFPNLAYMAEIYLNINLNTTELKQLLADLDKVIRNNTPRLSLQQKNKKALVSTLREAMQVTNKQQEVIETTETSASHQGGPRVNTKDAMKEKIMRKGAGEEMDDFKKKGMEETMMRRGEKRDDVVMKKRMLDENVGCESNDDEEMSVN